MEKNTQNVIGKIYDKYRPSFLFPNCNDFDFEQEQTNDQLKSLVMGAMQEYSTCQNKLLTEALEKANEKIKELEEKIDDAKYDAWERESKSDL